MMPSQPALAYRRAATQQASVVGLVIALYDTLAGDLQRAAAAMGRNDIEERTRQLKHGLSVLTQLDSLIDMEHGGQTAIHLRRFYSFLRDEMLRAQFEQDSSVLENASTLLLGVRGAWQEVDLRATAQTQASGGISDGHSIPFDCLA